MRQIVFRTFLLGLLMLTLSFALAQSPLSTYLDRNPIYSGESVNLFVSTGDNTPLTSIDLRPLEKDFDILGTSQSSQLSIINGVTSKKNTLEITLIPKRDGALKIPALSVGNYKTAALTLTVTSLNKAIAANNAPDIFMEMSLKPESLYVHAQATLVVRLYIATGIERGSITAPEAENAFLQRIPEDLSLEATRGGKRYRVVERHYIMIPSDPGKLRIKSPVFVGVVDNHHQTRLKRRLNISNPTDSRLRVSAKDLTVKVNPIPRGFNQSNWLPASQLDLTQNWTPDPSQKLAVGQPLTRIITIHAKGLTEEALPTLKFSGTNNLKSYADKPISKAVITTDGILSERAYKVAYIPTQAGKVTIPALQIPWWDTETGKRRVATLPEQHWTVMAATTPSITAPTSATPATIAAVQSQSSHDTSNNLYQANNHFWQILAGLFLLLWLATLFWMTSFLPARKRRKRAPASKTQEQIKRALASLKQACDNNNPHLTRQALIEWGRLIWPHQHSLMLSNLLQYCQDENSRQAIEALDTLLYSDKKVSWQGKTFWRAIQPFLKQPGIKEKQNLADLPRLYP